MIDASTQPESLLQHCCSQDIDKATCIRMADRDRLALGYSRQKDKLRARLLQDVGVANYQLIEDALANLGSYAITDDFEDLYRRLANDIGEKITSYQHGRALPVRAREQVVDEWGGLVKLHDDVQKIADIEQRRQEQIKKLAYRRELEEQIKQSRQIRLSNKSFDSLEGVRPFKPFLNESSSEAKRSFTLARMREESQEDLQRAAEFKRNQEALQREEFMAKLRYEAQKDKIENEVSQIALMKEQQRMNEVNRQMILQKQKVKREERLQDQHYGRAGFFTHDSNEVRRKKFLEDNHVRNYEMANLLEEFRRPKANVGRNSDGISYHDRVRHEREEQDRQKAVLLKQEQSEVLRRQMYERQQAKAMERYEDGEYAMKVRDHSFQALSYDQEQLQREKERKLNYRTELQRQIEEKNLSRAKIHTMSSDERLMNGPALDVFRRGVPEVYSNLPGLVDSSNLNISPDRSKLKSRGLRRGFSNSPSTVRNRSFDQGEDSPLKLVHRSVLGMPSTLHLR